MMQQSHESRSSIDPKSLSRPSPAIQRCTTCNDPLFLQGIADQGLEVLSEYFGAS